MIGISGDAPHNLKSRGVNYREAPMRGETYDLDAIREAVDETTKLVLIQRSRGYMDRKALFPEDIRKIIAAVKEKNPETICFVDNCYGEFTCREEPIELGADITAGSLIKNAGGGMAPTGGYICGRADLVDRCAQELTAPGLGGEMGSYAASYRPFFQGLFMAPHITRQAVMGAEFAAEVFSRLGFHVSPEPGHLRSDLITAIELDSEKICVCLRKQFRAGPRWIPMPSRSPVRCPDTRTRSLWRRGRLFRGLPLKFRQTVRSARRTPCICRGLTFEHAVLAVMGAAEKILKEKNA